MLSFIRRHAASVIGFLTGFDRLVFRGTLRQLARSKGVDQYVNVMGVRYEGYEKHYKALTETVKNASIGFMEAAGRRYKFLESPKTSKEEVALEIAKRERITTGPICALGSVEPCQTFDIGRNPKTNRFDFVPRRKKCLFIYHYAFHPIFGFMNARIQTWLPFNTQVCINGREWLSRDMDAKGLAYRRYDNCFPWPLGGHPKPAIRGHLKTGQWKSSLRDVEEREVAVLLAPYGQRLERREATTGPRPRPPGVAAAKDRDRDGRSPRDGERLPQGRWVRCS